MPDFNNVVPSLRAQFPALNRPVDGQNTLPVHFDNPAGTQVPQRVMDAPREYWESMNANAGGTFPTSHRNDAMVKATREIVADFINAPRPDEIAFGPNMTTLNFGLSRAIGKTLQPGDELVLTRMDHDANVAPWMLIADDLGLTVKWVDIHDADATLDMSSLEAVLSEKTRVVATVHAANSVGTINPIQQIADMAHQVGAYHVVDGVQSAPHLPVDVQALGCDFFLCSAYKFFGPHLGLMWGKFELMESLPAYKVRPAKDSSPYRWEVGTPVYETINATKAALEYLAEIGELHGDGYAEQFPGFSGRRLHFKTGMAALAAYERELAAHLIEILQSVPGIDIVGITEPERYEWRVPTVVFSVKGKDPHAVAQFLADHHIYVWSGHYYAVEIMDRLGKAEEGGMVRVGLAHYNTHAELERLEAVLQKLVAE
jgi:cysteine desulfurase family protein (TIGR01976 family)